MKAIVLKKVDGLKLWMTVVVLMTAVAVFADEGANEAVESNGPCRQDIERLCPGVTPGDGAIRRCLREHRAEVSDACKAKMKAHVKRKMKERQNRREARSGEAKSEDPGAQQ